MTQLTSDDRALLPFLPLVYVAWSDGELAPDELERLRALIHAHDDLDPADRARLERWLDPADPPSAAALSRLLATVRAAVSALPRAERRSLAELGLALARRGAPSGTAAALGEIEQALGVAGREASRELGPPVEPGDDTPEPAPARSFDPARLQARLDGEYRAVRDAVRHRLSEPRFRYRYGIPSAEYRAVVLEWARVLAADGVGALGLPREYGGRGDIGAFLAAFETLATHDLSLAVKFGVQFGLFAGSVLLLGTERHHRRYLRDAATLALPGCFAMTELGHGSNVRDILTEARYDVGTESFVVDTPLEAARKEWIGNAACDGRMATVFAQLIVGDERHGVHAFLVPIRDARGEPMPGVTIGDCGEKAGLNGVDNGRLWFHAVRVPRENLLNRYADVAADGSYTSPIASPSRRFFTMLGTLVGGRVSISAAALSAVKSGLAVAVRYAAVRRQFGPAGGAEVPILDYRSHQRRLLPAVATTYACDAAVKELTRRYAAGASDSGRDERDARELETFAAGLKAYVTRHAVDTLQACRECCGGQGYLLENRVAQLRADADVFTTFEGDNTVLLQLVAKSLLTEWRQQFGSFRVSSLLRHLGRRASARLTQLNPVVTRNSDTLHLRDAEVELDLLRYREERLLGSAARRLKWRMDDGADSFDAFTAVQDHLLHLAVAHVERVVLEHCHAAERAESDPAVAAVLGRMRALFALAAMERDLAWFLESGAMEPPKSRAVRAEVNALSGELRPDAVALVDGFGIPAGLLAAPIALGATA